MELELVAANGGTPALIVLRGPSGIGKSVLANRLGALERNRSVVFEAAFAEEQQDTAYQGTRELVASLLSRSSTSNVSQAMRVDSGRQIRELHTLADLLGPVPGLSRLGAAVRAHARLTARSEAPRRYLNDRVAFYVDLMCARPDQMHVALIDDIQWADPGTLEVMLALLRTLGERTRRGEKTRLAMVWTLRPDAIDAWRMDRLATVIDEQFRSAEQNRCLVLDLGALTHDAIPPLAENFLQRPVAFSPDLVHWLHEATGGSPGRVQTLLARMDAWGCFSERPGPAQLIDGAGRSVLLRDAAIELRTGGRDGEGEMRRLSADARGLLEAGAIWGRTFPVFEAAHTAGVPDAQIGTVIREITNRGLARETFDVSAASVTAPALLFSSGAVYARIVRELPAAFRRSAHASAAAWWDARYQEAVAGRGDAADGVRTDTDVAELVRMARRAAAHHEGAGDGLAAVERLIELEEHLLAVWTIGPRHEASIEDRRAALALLEVAEELDQTIGRVIQSAGWGEDAERAFHLDTKHLQRAADSATRLGLYRLAGEYLDRADVALQMAPDPDQRLALRIQAATTAARSGDHDRARRAVADVVYAVEHENPAPERYASLFDALAEWPDVGPVRRLVEILSAREDLPDDVREGGAAATLRVRARCPWGEDERPIVDAHLQSPDERTLDLLLDQALDWDTWHTETPARRWGFTASSLESRANCVRFVDRLALLADAHGWRPLARRARREAYERVRNVKASVEKTVRSDRQRALLKRADEAPFSKASLDARFTELVALLSSPLPLDELRAHLADPRFDVALAEREALPQLAGALTVDRVEVARQMLRRSGVSVRARSGIQRWLLERIEAWDGTDDALNLGRAALAGTIEPGKHSEAALRLWRDIIESTDDLDLWQQAVESARSIAERSGVELDLGDTVRAEFDTFGQVRPPDDNATLPDEPVAAEQAAERALRTARMAADPEISEQWFRVAISLYERVPDGQTRRDEIYEMAFVTWERVARKALTDGPERRTFALSAADRAARHLLESITLNERLGDLRRVDALRAQLVSVMLHWAEHAPAVAGGMPNVCASRVDAALEHGALSTASAALDDARGAAVRLAEIADSRLESTLARMRELVEASQARLEERAAELGEPWHLDDERGTEAISGLSGMGRTGRWIAVLDPA